MKKFPLLSSKCCNRGNGEWHNLALVERVEQINKTLTQTAALPPGENLETLELFGYTLFPEWIFAPEFRNFWVSQLAGEVEWVNKVVRFRLVAEPPPKHGQTVLNATGLQPAID
jgi:hypothetical protein